MKIQIFSRKDNLATYEYMLDKLQNFNISERNAITFSEDFIEVCIAVVADFWFGFVAMQSREFIWLFLQKPLDRQMFMVFLKPP